MRAVEEGAKEWRENQSKLRARRDAMRAQAERSDPRNLLSRARTDHLATEIDHGHDQPRTTFRTCCALPIAWEERLGSFPSKCFNSELPFQITKFPPRDRRSSATRATSQA